MSRLRASTANATASRVALCAGALCLALCLAPAARVGAAKGGLKKSDAQKLVAALSLFELSKGAVEVKEISSTATAATATADVKMGFRFERDAAGVWRASEVRVGERQWEDFDLLARGAGADTIARARAELDAVAARLAELSLAKQKRDEEKKRKGGSHGAGSSVGASPSAENADGEGADAGAGKKKKSKEKAAVENPHDLVLGALRVKNPESALSAMGKSAVVEAEVEGVFEFVRDAGAWRVASVRVGGEKFEDFDAMVRALDAEKIKMARADLDALASALQAFRRERGFYVVADSETVLVDHLNPRYTKRVIRIDPWHRPYEYMGTPDNFTLRSLGADGKPNTADDVIKRNS
ncbi:MAG: type II secretion system protein GspG [Pyrinomonadaceae bacterium]